MPLENHITSSCVISNNRIFKNNTQVFISKQTLVPGFLAEAYHHFGLKYPKFFKMDSLSKLGWLAAEVLLEDVDLGNYKPAKKGLLLTNANSSLDTDTKYFETVKDIPSPALFVYTLPNIVAGEISIRHKFKGENAFYIFKEFNVDFLEQYTNNLINNNILQVCICGWIDLIDEQYKSVLFLVEKTPANRSTLFNRENINKTYHCDNG